ncbi:hypothetical protein B566_EDAN006839 [Ephemera danica]|nr:hypothetical protein B566_EDAN006839 [Ephemera danica]
MFLTNINNLQNVVICREVQRTNVDLNVIVEEIFSQFSHFLGPGCRPHQSLTVRLQMLVTHSNLFQDLPDLWLEAHVQHAVSLIQHQISAATHVGGAVLQEVNQSAWRCYNYLHSLTQLIGLWGENKWCGASAIHITYDRGDHKATQWPGSGFLIPVASWRLLRVCAANSDSLGLTDWLASRNTEIRSRAWRALLGVKKA